MWSSLVFLIFGVLWNAPGVDCDKNCTKSNFYSMLGKTDALVMGCHDSAIFMASVEEIDAIENDDQFIKMLEQYPPKRENLCQVLVVRAMGVPQFFIAIYQPHQTTLMHLPKFPSPITHRLTVPLSETGMYRMLTITGGGYRFKVQYGLEEDILLGHRNGSTYSHSLILQEHNDQLKCLHTERIAYEFDHEEKNGLIVPIPQRQGFKWVVRNQEQKGKAVYECVAQTKHNLGMSILYKRRQPVIDFLQAMNATDPDYVVGKDELKLTTLMIESRVMLLRKGWLCSFSLVAELTLAALIKQMRNINPYDSRGWDAKQARVKEYLLSTDGKETTVVIITNNHVAYKTYITWPYSRSEYVCNKVNLNDMEKRAIPDGHKVEGVDLDLDGKTLKIYQDSASFKIDLSGGKYSDYSIPSDLLQTDHIRRESGGFKKGEMPWQINDGYTLNRSSGQITVGSPNNDSMVLASSSSELIDYMLYFMPPKVPKEKLWKGETMLYGLVKCTLFFTSDPTKVPTARSDSSMLTSFTQFIEIHHQVLLSLFEFTTKFS